MSEDYPSRSIDRLIEGLRLLAPFDDDVDVCAEHDAIYAGPSIAQDVGSRHVITLLALGWRIDRESGRWLFST